MCTFFCSASENQFPLQSSLVTSEDLPVLRRMFWLMTKRNCHDLVVEIVIGCYIYMGGMDIGGHSRRRTRGARTRQSLL